jgi:hypothetical protein
MLDCSIQQISRAVHVQISSSQRKLAEVLARRLELFIQDLCVKSRKSPAGLIDRSLSCLCHSLDEWFSTTWEPTVSIASQACFMLPYDQNSLFGIVATKV